MFPDTDEPSSGAGADRSAVVLSTSCCEGSGTVNLADAVSVDPLDKTSWAVMSWAPGASVPKSKALAVEVEAHTLEAGFGADEHERWLAHSGPVEGDGRGTVGLERHQQLVTARTRSRSRRRRYGDDRRGQQSDADRPPREDLQPPRRSHCAH